MFEKVLVANRGEIACRVLRTCARLGIKTVAVYSDADAGAPHVSLADEAIRLGPAPVRDSYLNLDAVMRALAESGADAVHPGYGLMSENPAFARAVGQAGARFVGPSPEALAALGDKVEARAMAARVGLSPPPGSPGPVTLAEARRLSDSIGYPLLVKAAAGGGGIGMHRVGAPNELDKALEVAATRARAAFGDERVYLERYLESPRHIELQLARDELGQCAALGERECSVQRRHQKIVEESPSPAGFLADQQGQAVLSDLTARAQRLLDSCNYVGLATVEFVADASGELYFLEVNARLQVEHPVTEMRAGLDLVEAQLSIAAGVPLGPQLLSAELTGHAIEARLYAEDPEKGFLPQPGRVVVLALPEGEGIRIDTGVAAGYEVTSHYDPLLLKVIAHGSHRRETIERLDRALAELSLELRGKTGTRKTNQALLRRVLASAAFRHGNYDTGLCQALLDAAD